MPAPPGAAPPLEGTAETLNTLAMMPRHRSQRRDSHWILVTSIVVAVLAAAYFGTRGSDAKPDRIASPAGDEESVSAPNDAMAPIDRVAVEIEPTAAPEPEEPANDWPDFAPGSLGAALAQYHDRPWSFIQSQFSNFDFNADAIEAGFIPWETARLNAQRFLPSKKAQIELIVCSRFLRQHSVADWKEWITARWTEADSKGRAGTTTEADIESFAVEATALVATIVRAVDARYDEVVATESYKKMPLKGFQDFSGSRGTIVFDLLAGIGGWHCLIEIHDYEIQQVAEEIDALTSLKGRVDDLVAQF
jgi:hypothetical protein